MGGAVSAGRDNYELVEELVRARYLRSPHVQRVFRAVDRGDYFLPTEKEHAYTDGAWKSGLLHLSAPCIYCDVMEGLKLRPGLSFLNLGSGTGYLSTMAGLILGTSGINHGIELHEYVVQYARERLQEFLMNSPAIDEFDFCMPKFIVGNCLHLPANSQLYDRVYCGAACPKEHEGFIKKLLKIGGILVMPYDDYLLRIKRISEIEWVTKKVVHVSFTTLVSVSERKPIEKLDVAPPPLTLLCRSVIRKILRDNIAQEKPELVESLMKTDVCKAKNRKINRTKTFCIPIDEDDGDSDDFNRLHNLDIESGSREMNALLRLVLSMGNRAREASYDNRLDGLDMYDFNHLSSSSDEPDSSSSDSDDESLSDEPAKKSAIVDMSTCDESGQGSYSSSEKECKLPGPSTADKMISESNSDDSGDDKEKDDTGKFVMKGCCSYIRRLNRLNNDAKREKSDNDLGDDSWITQECRSGLIDEIESNNKNREIAGPSSTDKSKSGTNSDDSGDDKEHEIEVSGDAADMQDSGTYFRRLNKLKKEEKSDSGVGDDSSITAECGSTSINDNDPMDTNSSEENFTRDSPNGLRNQTEEEGTVWSQRKRHLTNQDSTSDMGDSTDSDCDERAAQSKMKRKSPLPPYDKDRKLLSDVLKERISKLPLPQSLIIFINMDRDCKV